MSKSRSIFQFGPFRLDLREKVLLRDGARVPIPPKALEILSVLAMAQGGVVGKDQLMDAVWPNEFVEEGNLSQQIFILRKAVETEGSKYIETVPTRGYRFAGTISVLSKTEHLDQSFVAAEAITVVTSLAVLPFTNLTNDESNDYLSDGISESLISALSKEPTLKVLAHGSVFRYKGKDADPLTIGKELGVNVLVLGDVGYEDDELIIRTHLVDAIGGWELFGRSSKIKDEELPSFAQKLVEDIWTTLRAGAQREHRLTKSHSQDSEAFRDYLKGRYYWNKYTEGSLRTAIDYYQRAISRDASYPMAYVGIAESYYRLSTNYLSPRAVIPKAKAAVLQALRLDATLAEAHSMLGIFNLRYDWDRESAVREFRQAIALSHQYASIHLRYAIYLVSQHRFAEGIGELKVALECDPLSLQVQVAWGTFLWQMREYEQALEKFSDITAMEPNYYPARVSQAVILASLGRFAESLVQIREALKLDDSGIAKGFFGHIFAISGQRLKARGMLQQLLEERQQNYVPAYGIALIYVALGETDAAFEWLETAYNDRDELLTLLGTDPRLDDIRSDERYLNLLRRVGIDPMRS